jgi:hypothetical protein
MVENLPLIAITSKSFTEPEPNIALSLQDRPGEEIECRNQRQQIAGVAAFLKITTKMPFLQYKSMTCS